MSEKNKKQIVSLIITFLSVFLPALGTEIALAGNVQWTSTLILTIVVTASRTALKVLLETKLHSVAGINKV